MYGNKLYVQRQDLHYKKEEIKFKKYSIIVRRSVLNIRRRKNALTTKTYRMKLKYR